MVVVTTDKAKEQEIISRTRERIDTKQEQIHITHEKVNTAISNVIVIAISLLHL